MRSNLLMNCMWYEDITPEDMANELGLPPEAFFRKVFQEEEFTEVEINKIKARLGLTKEETDMIFFS